MSRGPQPDFDRVARLYRWAEYVCYGPLLQRVRTFWLEEIANSRSTLLLGDGDGRFLAALLRRNPRMEACAVDTSAAMLRLLRRRCVPEGTQTRLLTVQASALTFSPPPGTDLVVSHFFLDCLREDEVYALARRLAGTLQSETRWLVSDFALPRQRWVRPLAKGYVRTLYFAFRLLTGLQVTSLPDISAALHEAGFVRTHRREWAGGMLFSEIWQLRDRAFSARQAQP